MRRRLLDDWQGGTQTLLSAESVTSYLPPSPLVWSVLPSPLKSQLQEPATPQFRNPYPQPSLQDTCSHLQCNLHWFPGVAWITIHNSVPCYCNVELSHVRLFCGPMDCSPPGFSRQEYWSELPFPLPRHLPDPGIEPVSPVSPALTSRFFTSKPRGKPIVSSSIL